MGGERRGVVYADSSDALVIANRNGPVKLRDLNISSIVIVSVILAVETEFGIEISDEDLVEMTAVGDAVRFITDKLAKQ